MTETASLVIKVDSSSAKRATSDLDSLAKQGAKTEGAIGKLKSGVGALGTAFAALGGGVLIGKFLGAVISNTIEADKVQAQLAARIKSTGGAAGLALGDLNNMAKGLQNVTTYGDEAIGSAQSLLLTFTNIHRETFPKALEATLNLATAMGTDLNSAAVLVGKALNDPIQGVTALRRVGVQLTDAQEKLVKKLVETGDAASAQKIILGELETEMGGAARAARDTLGGALDAAKEAFGDLLEGDTGGAGIKGTKAALEDLIDTMHSPDTKAAFAQLVNGIFSVANAAVVGIQKLIDFNNQLEVSLGLKGKGDGTRNGTGLDFLAGAKDRLSALLHGDTKAADLAGKRMASGFGLPNAPSVADFTNVTGGANTKSLYPIIWRTGERDPALSVNPNGDPDTGTDKVGGKSGGGRSRKAMPDFSAEDRQALADLVAKTAEANQQFDRMAATLAGPLQEAELRHKEALQEITDVGKQAGRSSQEIADAKAAETKRYEEETEAIKAQLDPVGQALKNQALDLELIGKSNAEREVMNALLQKGIDLRSQEAQAALAQARANTVEGQSRQQAIDLMDDFRRGAANALTDFVTGAKSAKDALKDFFDELAAQITQAIANKWMDQLFGSLGSDGAGTKGGGWLSGLLGALFGSGGGGAGAASGGSSFLSWMGGGYASGGYTGPGAMTQPAGIVHKGEVVWSQADIAAAGGVGAVEAMRKGGGNVTNITVNVPRSYEYHSASQVAQATAAAQGRAMARNR